MFEGTSCLIKIFFFLRGSICGVGGLGTGTCLKAAVKDFLFISRGFRFDVNNPNSILIFNS